MKEAAIKERTTSTTFYSLVESFLFFLLLLRLANNKYSNGIDTPQYIDYLSLFVIASVVCIFVWCILKIERAHAMPQNGREKMYNEKLQFEGTQ